MTLLPHCIAQRSYLTSDVDSPDNSEGRPEQGPPRLGRDRRHRSRAVLNKGHSESDLDIDLETRRDNDHFGFTLFTTLSYGLRACTD